MAATAFLVGVALLVITVLFVFVLPLLRGADQASRSQNAADAAAIAGGKQVRELVLNRLAAGDLSVLSGPWGSAGSSDASIYAGRNDATLIRYSFDAVRDEVRAEIRFNKVPADGVARAERSAAVELGLALGRCTVSRDEIEPEPEPSPTESDDDEDEDEEVDDRKAGIPSWMEVARARKEEERKQRAKRDELEDELEGEYDILI